MTAKPAKPMPQTPQTPAPREPDIRAPRRGCNPFAGLFRFVGNRLSCALIVFVAIFGGIAGCALFAPGFFAQSIKIAQGAGLSVYTLVLGVTGNPALKITSFDADVTAETTINREMGVFALLYGEGAKVTGKIQIALGADLKSGGFGVLACSLNYDSLRFDESRGPLAPFAFEKNDIRQEALKAFSKEAAQVALTKHWAEAKTRLEGQFVSWGLGVTVPATPTVTTCPEGIATAPSAPTVPAATPKP